MDRTQQRLGVETSKSSVNSDTFLKINLEGKERLLPPDEINKIVNVGDRFDIERQRSPFYRIIGTINPTMSNPLFNLSDNSVMDKFTWAGFNSYYFLDTSYPKDNNVSDPTDLTFSESIKRFLKEQDGWFGYIDPDITKSGLCNFIDVEPKRERFSFIPDITPFHAPNIQPIKNWELIITYPKEMDKTHNLVNGGLLIVEAVAVVVSTRSMVAIGMPCLHNLSIGDTVRITGTVGYNGDHVVVRTGSLSSRIKKLFGGKESEYYFRIFRKVKTRNMPVIEADDNETYRVAFSESIFSDSISQFIFNEDIDISDLTDNLNRPLSELYLTTIKTSSNGLFVNVSSGIETPFMSKLNTSGINTFLQTIPAINKIHNGGSTPFQSHTPLESQVSILNNNNVQNNNDYYGDLVEYNELEVKETVLAEVSHRFNTLSRETVSNINYVSALGQPPVTTNINLGPRQEGYFYKAHSLIRIREFSNYVEQGDLNTSNIPDYAVNLLDGRYLWRDILDIGFNESNEKTLEYPFLNGCHYMYSNYCFYVRRQDPFDNWGLFYSNFPSDPIGERITNKFITNSEEDVC